MSISTFAPRGSYASTCIKQWRCPQLNIGPDSRISSHAVSNNARALARAYSDRTTAPLRERDTAQYEHETEVSRNAWFFAEQRDAEKHRDCRAHVIHE